MVQTCSQARNDIVRNSVICNPGIHFSCGSKQLIRLTNWLRCSRLCCQLYYNMVAVLSAHLLGALKEHVGLYSVQEKFHGNVGLGTVLTVVV